MTNICQVPPGSGVNPIFASHLWMGGLTANSTLCMAAEMYNPGYSEWFPGPLTTDGTATTTPEVMEAFDRVWTANADDVAIHVAYNQAVQNGTVESEFPNGYTIPEWMFEWPAHGDYTQGFDLYLAPFFDFNLDGVYDPQAGDYPVFCGHDCVSFIFNDKGGLHETTGGLPLGIEVHGMLYAFEDTGNANLENTVFVSYKIINRGTQTLTESHVAMFSDFQLPQEYIGTNVHRAAVFGYHGDSFDENGYGNDAAIIAMSILAGPWADDDGLDNSLPDDTLSIETNSYGRFGWGYNDGFPDNERLGLSHSMYFNTGFGVDGDPTATLHFYRYMSGFLERQQLIALWWQRHVCFRSH